MSWLELIILSIVEGLTEFLPVSSTGHMILLSAFMEMEETEFLKSFEIAIQIGAILSVLTLYYKKFLVSLDIYIKLFVAFLPAAAIGFVAYKYIKALLFNPFVVSVALIIGGIILIMLDKWTENKESKFSAPEKISYKGALQIGFFQCLAMIPGTSRSAASIFGGIYAGFDRKQAAEFSFLLAIPTMFAATIYDLYKTGSDFNQDQINMLLVGSVIAFFSALAAVKGFIALLTRYGFKHFGYYRIALGLMFLVFSWYFDLIS